MRFKESQTRGLAVRAAVSSDNAGYLTAPSLVTHEALMWNHLAGSLTSMSGTFLEHQTRRSQTAIALAQREGREKKPTGTFDNWVTVALTRAEVCENNIVLLPPSDEPKLTNLTFRRQFSNPLNCPTKFAATFQNQSKKKSNSTREKQKSRIYVELKHALRALK